MSKYYTGRREISIEEVIEKAPMTESTHIIMSMFSGYHFDAAIPVLVLDDYQEIDLIICNDAGLRFADRYIEKDIDGEIVYQHNLYPFKDVNSLYSRKFGDESLLENNSEMEEYTDYADLFETSKEVFDPICIAKISGGSNDTLAMTLIVKEPNDLYVMSEAITCNGKIVQFANSPISAYKVIDMLCEEKGYREKQVVIYDALLNEAISECLAARNSVIQMDEKYWDLYYSIPEDVRAEL